MSTHYDVVVIGTGAGGGTLAYALAGTGKWILLLDRGPRLPREKENWDTRAVILDGRYNPGEKWRSGDGEEFAPGVKYAVGGNTKVYGAALLRLRPADFGEIHHEGGISPAWPLGYKEFEPWYAAAEQLYRVRGLHGVDPSAGPSSSPYPHPPIRHEARTRQLVADFARQGLRPWPLPLGLLLDDEHPEKEPCIRCDTCDGFPCLVKGKADAQVICVEPALRHPNVTLLTGAYVERLETDATGRSVRTVHANIGGERMRFDADIVVSACGAVNSTALLLRSASDLHPQGLGNSSGLLGRHYMAHQNSAVLYVSPGVLDGDVPRHHHRGARGDLTSAPICGELPAGFPPRGRAGGIG
ncbi:MAG: GMC family oxidoreductase N-terminal domain-containing protein, partial [Candidatus Sumerlaeia bacterium]|nr:GMC family oxidoreductase N-terminal domain-containing protein [Candidatus Sumerlaeia bacterium]